MKVSVIVHPNSKNPRVEENLLKLPRPDGRGIFISASSGAETHPKQSSVSPSPDLMIGEFREGGLKTVHVYVNAPPLEGKANKATIEALANHFGTKKGRVVLLKGDKSKNKLFEID